ncbi:hypothetical protein NX059_001287 [Plenodomus lindquistii]|nr:hypothetical protein NX059_001287 [Plenodomus lindquistii]
MVIVRGELKISPDPAKEPSIEQLRSENEQLRREIEHARTLHIGATPRSKSTCSQTSKTTSQALQRPPRIQWFDQDEDGLEQKLWGSLTSNRPAPKTLVSGWDDIVLPSPSCLENLIDYDEKWNSWVHYALEYPRFREECDDFMAAIASGVALELAN